MKKKRGEGGIRTHGSANYSRFRVYRLRPLGHLSRFTASLSPWGALNFCRPCGRVRYLSAPAQILEEGPQERGALFSFDPRDHLEAVVEGGVLGEVA